MQRSTTNTQWVQAPRRKVYDAFTNAAALAAWLAPGDMKGEIKDFDLREGGGFTMSLRYPDEAGKQKGKTNAREDRFTARFVELSPPGSLILVSTFYTDDPSFKGEMVMEVQLEEAGNGTNITLTFNNIPQGISLKDNEAGTASSLQKLAHYVSGQ